METRRMYTLLIIEDDPNVLSMMVRYLAHLGYEIITAVDGMEGMKKLEQGGFDLVITDIVMPYLSGVGVVSALKSRAPEIPVIAMTGYGREPESAAAEQQADLVLSKPVKMVNLKQSIEKLLGIEGGS